MSNFTYTGPSVSAAFVTGVFNDSWDLATTRAQEATDLSHEAVALAGNPERLPGAPQIPSALVPTLPQISTPLSSAEAQALFTQNAAQIKGELVQGFSTFLSQYFGEMPEFSAARDWLTRALTTGGTGLNATVEAQIYERERTRIFNEASRDEGEVLSDWAAKRFPLPPGAAAAQIMRIRKGASEKLAAAAREVAVQKMQSELENVRLAVSQAVNLRLSAINAAGDYIRTLATASQTGVNLATALVDAQARIASTLTSFYQAQVAAAELPVRVATTNAELVQRTNEANQRASIDSLNQRVSATVAAAQSLGTQAAAALNALSARAGIDASERL